MYSQIVTQYIHRTGQKQRRLFGSFFILFFICTTLSSKAQTEIEVGLYLADFYYIGYLNPNVQFKNALIAYGAFLRF